MGKAGRRRAARSGGEAYVNSDGRSPSKGKELFAKVAQAWNSYIALNPPKPNAELARMVRCSAKKASTNRPRRWQVLQIAVAARPTSAALYASLAEAAYKAHNRRVGDLAAAKAVSLAPAAERARLKTELETVQEEPDGTTSSAATAPSEH